MRSFVDISGNSFTNGNLAYFATTVVTADALTALAVPDADSDPAHPWHWWESLAVPNLQEVVRKVLDIRTGRIVLPNFRYVLVIDGDSVNPGSYEFEIKMRLLWQLG